MRTSFLVAVIVATSCTFDYASLRGEATTSDGAMDTRVSPADGAGAAGAGGSPGGVSGGSIGAGGAIGTGGAMDGGGIATGGSAGTGGHPGSGGILGTGGFAGTNSPGDASASGGATGTGGMAGTDGRVGTGGGTSRPVFTELVADGFVRSEANAVSVDGKYVAGNATLTGGYIHAIRWTDADFQELGTDVGWVGAYGKGISDDGATVVGYIDTRAGQLAFRWDGQIHELLPLVSGGQYAKALGVSGDGRIVFGTSTDQSNENVPVRWVDGAIQQLPVVQGHRTATPTGVDYDGGLIAGTGITATNDENDAVWWLNGVFSLGLARSEAFAVSGDGRFIVGAHLETVDVGPSYRATFRWSLTSGFEYLPPLSTGQLDCLPVSTNNDGAIVVGSCTELGTTPTAHWFLWTQARGSVSLDQVLLELGVDTSRYTGFSVTDISADGTTIVGNTSRNGVGMGYRAVIASVFP